MSAHAHRYDLVLPTRRTTSGGACGHLAPLLADVLEPEGLVVIETSSRNEPGLPLDLVMSAATVPRGLRCSRIDHGHLPRQLRPGHERSRRRHQADGGDLRQGRGRRRPRPDAQADALHRRGRVSIPRGRPLLCENVVVDVFSELVVDFARKHDAKTMVKGLRVTSDFEWEFQMNHLNRSSRRRSRRCTSWRARCTASCRRAASRRSPRSRKSGRLVPAAVAALHGSTTTAQGSVSPSE